MGSSQASQVLLRRRIGERPRICRRGKKIQTNCKQKSKQWHSSSRNLEIKKETIPNKFTRILRVSCHDSIHHDSVYAIASYLYSFATLGLQVYVKTDMHCII
jgi:hypothetical protein